jgi:hypothetical protein
MSRGFGNCSSDGKGIDLDEKAPMPPDADGYDLFVSYAREDNRDGWISRFVERLLAEHQRVTGGRPPLKPFFDTSDIRSLDDWRLRIHDALAQSRLLLAFVSPTYFTRPWCRREWRTWIDHEIAQHILSSGVAPIHIVEVPGLTHESDERQVARAVAALCGLAPPHEPFVKEGRPGTWFRCLARIRSTRQHAGGSVPVLLGESLHPIAADQRRGVSVGRSLRPPRPPLRRLRPPRPLPGCAELRPGRGKLAGTYSEPCADFFRAFGRYFS